MPQHRGCLQLLTADQGIQCAVGAIKVEAATDQTLPGLFIEQQQTLALVAGQLREHFAQRHITHAQLAFAPGQQAFGVDRLRRAQLHAVDVHTLPGHQQLASSPARCR